MKNIGIGVPRGDGVAKVTGKAIYVDDLHPDGCWHGATVRASCAHARIVKIERDPAFDWTDVVIVTARDIPGENVIALITDDQPCLADGVVRHVEEAVALVAAPERERALDAARHVRITYEPLPVLIDPEQSIGSPIRIYGENNVFKQITIRRGDPPTVGRVVRGVYHVGHQEQLYLEPQGMIASARTDAGLTLIGSLQCPYYVLKALKRLLGHDRVNVVQATTGGGFGGKEDYPSMIAAHAALLCLKAGRPVKMIYRRDEDIRATTKRHPARVSIESLVAPDGRLLSWKADILMDGGAYNTLSPVVISRGLLHATGPYACPHVELSGAVVATHSPPNGAFRGFGAPQTLFAAERHMDRIARELGRSPLEIRRLNLYRDGDVTVTGQTLYDVGGAAVLEEALAAAEAPLPAVAAQPGEGGASWRSGRGLALAFHGCGFTGNGEAWLKGKAALELRDSKLHILTGATEIGQGAETIFTQIVAEELGISLDRVEVARHDTAEVPDSGPTVASRTTMVVGAVVQETARRMRAALQAETGSTSRDFDTLLAARTVDSPLRTDHTYEPDPNLVWDEHRYSGDAYPTFGWSCGIVDLDVDEDTGVVRYRRFVSATDVGRAINPVLAIGQLEGGALQALGWATLEEVVRDDVGRVRSDRVTTYIIPTSVDSPQMVTRLVEIPYAGGPFGAKGIGEIPMDGPAAAVAAAIEEALGVVLDRLPMTPERVVAEMNVALSERSF